MSGWNSESKFADRPTFQTLAAWIVSRSANLVSDFHSGNGKIILRAATILENKVKRV